MAVLLAWLFGRDRIDHESDATGDRLAFKALACSEAARAAKLEIDLLMTAPSAFYRL